MTRQVFALLVLLTAYCNSFAQTKTLIGIVPFKSAAQEEGGFSMRNSSNSSSEFKTAIQDAVADAFLKTKRFSLVEREKMDQLKLSLIHI